MIESDRLFILKARTSSESRPQKLLLKKLSRLWLPRGSVYSDVDKRLEQAGIVGLSNLYYPVTVFISLAVSIVVYLSLGPLAATGVLVSGVYFFFSRVVTWLRIQRRIKFVQHLGGFLTGLEISLQADRELSSAFEFVLERAPDGILRQELLDLTSSGTLKGNIHKLRDRITGKEARLFSSAIFLMSGIHGIQSSGVKKLTRILKEAGVVLLESEILRRSYYKAILVLAVLCFCLDIFFVFFVVNSGATPFFELVLLVQIVGLLLASELVDRIIGV